MIQASLPFLLLAVHYLADFCLTTHSMIAAKADGKNLWPIACHAFVHAILMALVVWLVGYAFKTGLFVLAVEWLSHLAIDTAKGRLTSHYAILADATRKPYWMLYGLDQFLHVGVIIVLLEVITI